MRHGIAHRKLGRDAAHRRALLRNLVTALVLNDRIYTTLPKAKEAQPLADKMVTLAKKGTDAARTQAGGFLFQPKLTIPKLFGALALRYADRPGGYTRVLKCGFDKTDGSPRALLEYVDAPGDTKLALAQSQIPAVQAAIKSQTQESPSLAQEESPSLSNSSTSTPTSIGLMKGYLSKRMRALNAANRTLTRAAQMPFLKSGFQETKFPAKDEEIRVHKQMWKEQIPGRDKKGQPRFVLKVKRHVSLEKRQPHDVSYHESPERPQKRREGLPGNPAAPKYKNRHLAF